MLPDGGFESEDVVQEILAEGHFFEVAYEIDNSEYRVFAVYDEITRPSAKPLHGPPVFRFQNVATTDQFRVKLPDLVDVRSVSLDDVPSPLQGDALSAAHDVYTDQPESLPLADVRQALEAALTDDFEAEEAYSLARTTLANHDDALSELGSLLFQLLEREFSLEGHRVLEQVAVLGRENPEAVAPHVNSLAQLVTTETYALGASKALATLAESEPSSVLDAVPALATTAESNDGKTRKWAVYAFSRISDEYPEELFPAVNVLVEGIQADDENLQTNALSALGRIAGSYPDAAVSIAEDLGELLDSEESQVRMNATGLLADIAQKHPEAVIEHAPGLAARLTDDETEARVNATIALNQAGEADPDAIRGQKERLVAALDDEHPDVRANACTLIGNAEVAVSEDKLRNLRDNDPDETVREQAGWAVSRLS